MIADMGGSTGSNSVGGTASHFTRSHASVPNFDWKSRCFLCGDVCSTQHRSSSSMIESPAGNDSDKPSMYDRVLQAARARQDDMITRF